MILSWLYQRLSHRDTAEMVLSEYDQSLEVTLLVTPAQHLCPAHHEHAVLPHRHHHLLPHPRNESGFHSELNEAS